MGHNVYVYHVIHKRRIVYVGRTKNPKARESHLSSYLSWRAGIRSYKITFTGPFKKELGSKIEISEIARHGSEYLLNVESSRQRFIKRLAIEKFNRGSISFFRKNGIAPNIPKPLKVADLKRLAESL